MLTSITQLRFDEDCSLHDFLMYMGLIIAGDQIHIHQKKRCESHLNEDKANAPFKLSTKS